MSTRLTLPGLFAAAAISLVTGCFQGTTPMGDDDDDDGAWSIADAITYRDDLNAHPGCTTEGLTYPAASIPGYQCAAKAYPFPAGTSEDTTKPIVLLIHGNSDYPLAWEKFPAGEGIDQLAERLPAAGFRTYAIDFRIDTCDDPQDNLDTENAARNIDHGWATPIAQHFIEAVAAAYPDRKLSIIGHSLGVTVTRDALRRLHVAEAGLWPRLADVVLLAGPNHGVSSFARLCGKNPTMRGRVACEMGPRDSYSPTDFMKPLNGPDGAYEAPCKDGQAAFGKADACGGNPVDYTTIVMRDISNGSYQDEFVSEASSAIAGADNHKVELTDFDESGYFFNGLLKNHYGSARSEAAIELVMTAVQP